MSEVGQFRRANSDRSQRCKPTTPLVSMAFIFLAASGAPESRAVSLMSSSGKARRDLGVRAQHATGFPKVLRSCAMDLASRAWERDVSGREDCSVQVPSLVLISDADVIGNES